MTSLDAMLAEVEEFDDLDAAYAEIRRKPYGFVYSGQRWVLPHIGELDRRIQAELENAESLTFDQIDNLFRRLFGPEQAARWEQVEQPGSKIELFFQRWIAHSGVKPGEEQASSGSSGSTGKSSRPTSGATTGSASRKRSTAKKPAKRAPRKAAPTAAQLAQQADAEWLAKHQALAASPPGNSST
ncbi:hypothetical protein [Paractinoplanes toevensis]|uniref:Uncharacterized protein n=1 Tax=Paractinoplanes toevensis TaxID=571911 RepID=A0A919T722_9ACTN|nr:hypothetical protein [Actinoplanes toevensis]GIM88751.1 hypothetical protein Ato02nite_005440 [Actinoplanes toevensis]